MVPKVYTITLTVSDSGGLSSSKVFAFVVFFVKMTNCLRKFDIIIIKNSNKWYNKRSHN